jgi:hypothetical protein
METKTATYCRDFLILPLVPSNDKIMIKINNGSLGIIILPPLHKIAKIKRITGKEY